MHDGVDPFEQCGGKRARVANMLRVEARFRRAWRGGEAMGKIAEVEALDARVRTAGAQMLDENGPDIPHIAVIRMFMSERQALEDGPGQKL